MWVPCSSGHSVIPLDKLLGEQSENISPQAMQGLVFPTCSALEQLLWLNLTQICSADKAAPLYPGLAHCCLPQVGNSGGRTRGSSWHRRDTATLNKGRLVPGDAPPVPNLTLAKPLRRLCSATSTEPGSAFSSGDGLAASLGF